MIYFIALLVAVLAYVIINFMLSKVKSLAPIAELIAVISGILVALVVVGAIHI
jgi:hypothetical protein